MSNIRDRLRNVSWPVSVFMYREELLKYKDEQWSSASLPKARHHKAPVCVISKEHYIESTRQYPIANIAHLYRIVRAEAQTISPYGNKSLWAITGRDKASNSYTVTYWSLKPVPDEITEHFRWIVPESLLLKEMLSSDIAYQLSGQKTKFFYYSREVGTKIMFEDHLVPTIQRFSELVSGSGKVEVQLIDDDYSSRLAAEVKTLNPIYWPGLFVAKQESKQLSLTDYKWPAVVSAAALLIYAVSVSSYQSYKLESLQSEVDEKQALVSSVVEKENQALENITKWKTYLDLKRDYPGVVNVYVGIADSLAKTDAKLSNIRVQGSLVTLYGLSPSATKTFESLATLHGFSDVKLDGNINIDRSTQLERFIIKLQYTGGNNES